MIQHNLSEFFDAYYYAHSCGLPYTREVGWPNFFGAIAENIVKRIAPRTVLDAGCAMGYLVEGLRARGVDAYGIDISDYAIQNVHPDIRPYCRVASVCDPLPQKYDLIINIEVLEHMPPADAGKAIENLCKYTDDILFTSTPNEYKESTHINVRPTNYWAELFAEQGFIHDVDFDGSFIISWAMRFCRKSVPISRIVQDYERHFWLLQNENSELHAAQLDTHQQLADYEKQLAAKNQRVIECEQTISTQEKALQNLQEQKDSLNIQLEQKNNQIDLMKNSRGWRMLEVLRRFAGRKSTPSV